jgi:hypothetical protein
MKAKHDKNWEGGSCSKKTEQKEGGGGGKKKKKGLNKNRHSFQ